MNPPFYTQAAFAALAGVSIDTVAGWIRTCAVESVKLGKTRLVRFPGGEPMSRTDPQFKLRMPAALRAQVERSAWAEHRSLSAEVVIRLESSFSQVAPSASEQERSE